MEYQSKATDTLAAEEVGLEGEWIETKPDLALPKRCEYLVSWKGN
jgi:hypothetical protein